MMRWRMSLLAGLLLFPGLSLSQGPKEAKVPSASPLNKDVAAFLKTHCFSCHGPDKKRGGIALHTFTDEKGILDNRKLWATVLQLVQSGDMPPPEKPRPPMEDLERFTQNVRDLFGRADKLGKRDPGRVTMRRLNRTEYNNTIRDLVGADFDATEFLPHDDVGYGFDNIGDVLTISPFLMERYFAAAESVMQRAIWFNLPKPSPRALHARFLRPGLPDAFAIKGPRLFTVMNRYQAEFGTTQEGDFQFIVRLWGQSLGGESIKVALDMDGKQLQTYEIKDEKPQNLEIKLPLKPGKHDAAIVVLSGLKEFDKKLPPHQNQPSNDRKLRGLVVERFELNGPLDMRPPSMRKLLATKHPDDKKQATLEILTRFASLAFRRPATSEEVARLVKIVEDTQARKESWEAGIQLAMQAVLCSPKFLFRVEVDDRPNRDEPYPLDDYQLASRLSYFLWSSMPDEELLALAAKKSLQQNLDGQVRRMLAKAPRSAALMDNFGMQWLHLRNLKNANPDPKLFPEWDESLRKSMLKETELFLEAIVREDRSILDLIDADFTFLNDRMGRHYGIVDTAGNRAGDKKKVPGGKPLKAEFERVRLSPEDRGGILTQASVLTINSNPTRTSPVKRGRWVLEQILGTPPPPPPPNVPELAEGEKVQTKGTLRQRMEQHRANPSCASCHARMDPIGFAFENFDAIGKFRTKDGDFPIDPSGTLPGGQSFKGPAELKVILKGKKDQFARCLTEKLLTYALGRGLEYYDGPVVDRILAALAQNNYRFSTLVIEIAKSDPFRMRRGKGPQ